ncbi:MAG: hypothetical protein KDI61_02315 [Alphaproteobacteria bacterium]|nr:hypothetical protein [Alphaproteobacteria bacterium]
MSRGRAKSPLVMEVLEEQERFSDWRVSGASAMTSGVQGGAIAPDGIQRRTVGLNGIVVGCREIEISRS